MRKNVASQLVSAQMVSTTDGSDVTSGTCNVAVEIDGVAGTGGTATHIANGKWEYAPIQADTNGDYLTFQFVLSGAVTQTVQIYTTFPQTGDSFARLGAPAGASVSADIATVDTVVDGILADTGTDGVVIASGQTVATVTDVTNTVNADVVSVSGDATAADNLEASLETMLVGTATGGTTSTVTSAITGHGDDTFINRYMIMRTGTLQYEGAKITDYDSATGTFTFAASSWTTGATNETFVIV